MAEVAKYLEYFRISFLNLLTYRARYFVGIITYIIYIAVFYYIWKAIFANSAVIDTFSLSQMVTYVAIGWISRSFFFNNLDREIETKVVNGSLALDLLKPVDFQLLAYAQTLGEGIFRFALFALPTALVAFLLFPIQLPHNMLTAAAFLFSTFLAGLVYTSINFMVGALAVPLGSIEGIAYAKQNLILFFSGLIVPFDMLPRWAGGPLRALPFASISYIPLNVYLGKCSGAQLALALCEQIFWVVALFFAARALWNLLIRRVVIQGG